MAVGTKECYKVISRSALRERYRNAQIYLDRELPKIDGHSEYDVFLSHSFNDNELIRDIRGLFHEWGYRTFVDWIDAAFLDREKVNKETAQALRGIMQNARVLIYATSENSKRSKWMNWECGYFDGFKGKVAIMPIYENDPDFFHEQEFLTLYDYITIDDESKPFLMLDGKIPLPLANWIYDIYGNYYCSAYGNSEYKGIGASLLNDDGFSI